MPDSLQLALDAVPVAIFLYQPDQILYANRAAAALLGRSQAELRGLRFEDVFEESREFVPSALVLKTAAGTKIPVDLSRASMLLDGAPVEVMTALKRELPRLPLPDSQRLFESIFESTVVGIAIIDESAHYVRVNRTYGEIYGYTPDELVGRHLSIIFPPQFFERAQETHDRFIRGEASGARSDWTVRRKDGEFIEISAFNSRVVTESGERFRVVAVIDITEQKRAQQAHELSEQRLYSLLESMGDAVWTVWADSLKLFYVNPAIETLTGYSVAEFTARESLLFEVVHPDDREYFLEHLREARSGERLVDLEHRIVRRDGAVRWVHKRFWNVKTTEGRRIGGIMTDVTDRKLAVEQAMQLELENERVRILSGFVRDAYHEFRTPLAIISTHLELMERNTANPQRQTALITGVRAQTSRILRLVDALVMMSRFDAADAFHFQPVLLKRLLAQVRSTAQESALRKGILLTLHALPEDLVVEGNEAELTTALQAVLANAILYTPDGGRVDIHVARLNEREIAVDILDTGIGIRKVDQERIFERFYRVDQAHSTEGFGLGLPVARRVVELHHGRIEVESDLGKGARFRLVFPAAQTI